MLPVILIKGLHNGIVDFNFILLCDPVSVIIMLALHVFNLTDDIKNPELCNRFPLMQ